MKNTNALIIEIAKNIFDHADATGSLLIERKGDSFEFLIKDGGKVSYNWDECVGHSRLAGNGVNFGAGLELILDMAETLKIDLHVDTTKGFSYSGVYKLGDAFIR